MRTPTIHILRYLPLLLLGAALSAQARPGGGVAAAAPQLKGPGPKGLCTSDSENANEKWVKDGWCKQIMETMTKEDCAKDDFEKLQQKAKSNQINGLDKYCSNISSKANNKNEFAGVMQQMIAALVIEESEWVANAKGPNITADGKTGSQIPKGAKVGNAKGLLQLSTDSVRKYKCCKDLKSDKDLNDPKKSLKCGTQIAIHWMQRDGEAGKGSKSQARGAARYFQPYREIDKAKRERMQKKVNQGYCNRNGKPDTQSAGATGTENRQ